MALWVTVFVLSDNDALNGWAVTWFIWVGAGILTGFVIGRWWAVALSGVILFGLLEIPEEAEAGQFAVIAAFVIQLGVLTAGVIARRFFDYTRS